MIIGYQLSFNTKYHAAKNVVLVQSFILAILETRTDIFISSNSFLHLYKRSNIAKNNTAKNCKLYKLCLNRQKEGILVQKSCLL